MLAHSMIGLKMCSKSRGVRRQHGDPITYLGRHFGTRLLQHAGGSAEGGAARRGHNNGTASFHYTECPLPDLLKLAGNDSAKPFVPAHHNTNLHPLADAVLLILFPELDAAEKALDRRQKEVDAMRAIADRSSDRGTTERPPAPPPLDSIRMPNGTLLLGCAPTHVEDVDHSRGRGDRLAACH